jgi:hypothetical protein
MYIVNISISTAKTFRNAAIGVVSSRGSGFIILALLIFIFLTTGFYAFRQKTAEKTNLLFLATLSPNIGTEISVARNTSLDLTLSYHPWKISDNLSLRHWIVSPELRFWNCRSYEGTFFGLHLLVGQFNVHAIPLTQMPKNNEYAGFIVGGGLSYGYHFPLSARWGMEFTLGLGYIRISYDRYECKECREKIAEGNYNYFGPTRLGMSLIYFLQ